MFSRRLFLLQFLVVLAACKQAGNQKLGKLTIGAVSYDEGDRSIEQYSALVDHLRTQLKTNIELEPTFNELQALEQIKRRVWSLVFAPPGLAAVAISEEKYLPLFPLEGVANSRSLIVVREESRFQKLTDLAGQVVALGEIGSATGYYLPLYNLYGLTLSEIRTAPTPKTVLEWIEKGEVAAGALSLADVERYRSAFKNTKFRVLQSNYVPPGSLLVGPMIEQPQQEQIRKALASASPRIISAAGYLPNGKTPDYKPLTEVIAKVRPLGDKIEQKPVALYN